MQHFKYNKMSLDENSEDCFLDVYVKHFLKGNCSTKEIVSQFLTFFFAGTDTTGNLAGMTLYRLAKHPDIQQKLLQELLQAVPNNDNF